uniref:Uncharacterized protein n=1 Tax=Arundo donax TaxID=35708 RepID=A0A0A8ZZ05_ARUDO
MRFHKGFVIVLLPMF